MLALALRTRTEGHQAGADSPAAAADDDAEDAEPSALALIKSVPGSPILPVRGRGAWDAYSRLSPRSRIWCPTTPLRTSRCARR